MNFKKNFNEKAITDFFEKCNKQIKTGTNVATRKFQIIKEKSSEKTVGFIEMIKDFKVIKLDKLSRNTKIGIGAGVLGVAVISSAMAMNMGTDVYKLKIQGQEAGYLPETEMVGLTIEEIKNDLSKSSSGIEIIVEDEAIVCEATNLKAKKVTFLTEDELKTKILEANLCKANAWAININGTNLVAASTEKEAQGILDGVINHYKSDGAEIVTSGFKETVAVTQAAVNVADIMKAEDAVSLILTGTKEPKTYTVQSGDNLWKIAKSNGISPYELQAANPGFEPSKLKVGQQLNLFQVKPYVTVQLTELVAAKEKIDFKVVYENTNALYKGEVKVKTAGVYGTKETKTEVVKENGIVVSSKELGAVVTAQPQVQVALKGTKSIATFTGSGSLSSPVNHIEISSAFGSRGGGRHTGVDLRNPKGTAIKAADDGVVTVASYSGSYGNIVKLSHGNGLETWYAHCDSMSVSVGQVVKKGETIATVGITGRATGYHLHFEVRINGTPQNPANYL